MPLPWMRKVKRRTLKDKGPRLRPEEIFELITKKEWPYKTKWKFYPIRDRALLSLLYLCCGRISEILGGGKRNLPGLVKAQFEDIGDVILIRNFQVLKTYQIRDEWPLPKRGQLAPFTDLIIEFLPLITTNLFNFGRVRGYQICAHITGKWPHWFRAQGEAYWMTFVKDPFRLATGLKLKDPKTLMEYIPFEWRDFERELKR